MTLAQMELRVVTLERKLTALARSVRASPLPNMNAWIDEIHGTFTDNATYRQAACLGRQWRKSLRPSAPRTRKTVAV